MAQTKRRSGISPYQSKNKHPYQYPSWVGRDATTGKFPPLPAFLKADLQKLHRVGGSLGPARPVRAGGGKVFCGCQGCA